MTSLRPPPVCCLHCGKPLGKLPRAAPHKRFCSPKHRNAWHAAERGRKLARLAQLEAEEQARLSAESKL